MESALLIVRSHLQSRRHGVLLAGGIPIQETQGANVLTRDTKKPALTASSPHQRTPVFRSAATLDRFETHRDLDDLT